MRCQHRSITALLSRYIYFCNDCKEEVPCTHISGTLQGNERVCDCCGYREKMSIEGNRKQEILYPYCNMTTITDGRGGVFSWIPEDAIVEFNMLYFNPGATRGNHYHPEFNEYFLVVSGEGIMVSKDSEGGERKIIHMSKGSCVRTPIGVIHTFYAISPVTAIAMLSKKWDDCNPPIVRMEIK